MISSSLVHTQYVVDWLVMDERSERWKTSITLNSSTLWDVPQDNVESMVMKGVWDFIEIFFVDKGALTWLPERLVDWLRVSLRTIRTSFPAQQIRFMEVFMVGHTCS